VRINSIARAGIATVAILALTISSANAEVDLPCRSVKLIVPWGAGGGTDVVFRTFAEEVNKQGANPKLQVVNVPGQSGNKGSKAFLNEEANGCALLAIHQSVITSYLNGQVDYTWDAFTPVARLTSTSSFVGASKNTPFEDIPGMVKFAKANPAKLVAASSLGSTSHFLMLMIEEDAGIEFKHVSYDGTRERLTALLAGNVDLAEVNLTSASQSIETGDLKVLAITTEKRNETLHEIKTLRENNMDIVYATERGIALPKGTSSEIVAYYEAMFEKAAKSPALIESLNAMGTDVHFVNSSTYKIQLSDTFNVWENLAKKVGIL